MRCDHRTAHWPAVSLVIILLSGSALVGCRYNATSPPSPPAAGIPDSYVETFYQFYLQSPDRKAPDGRGGYWARVATSMSPTMDPNKVSIKTALHYLGDPEYTQVDPQETAYAYTYISPPNQAEVLFVVFDAAGYVSRIEFANRSDADFSSWRRWDATTQPAH
ncbi:MAG TPA: hypothetical protein VFE47_18720 [Tepidisphaeraceae bacterium]|jgi:hypothetical protein|nr:hypothetical protein [Tepidisphaeraceae bacterium]